MLNQIKVRTIEDGAFPINEELAGLVPLALPSEQIALMEDIKVHGQREPIILWKGAVIDGRCRQKALTALGKFILYKELDSELSKEEVKAFVKSVNTRRNLTTTQKIASAAKEYIVGNKTIKVVSKSWGISSSILDNAVWLNKHHAYIIEELFNGNSVTILNKSGISVTSCKVSAIYAHYKRESELIKEVKEYGWQESTSLHCQKAKDWYYTTLRDSPIKPVPDFFKPFLAELANLKFQLINRNNNET